MESNSMGGDFSPQFSHDPNATRYFPPQSGYAAHGDTPSGQTTPLTGPGPVQTGSNTFKAPCRGRRGKRGFLWLTLIVVAAMLLGRFSHAAAPYPGGYVQGPLQFHRPVIGNVPQVPQAPDSPFIHEPPAGPQAPAAPWFSQPIAPGNSYSQEAPRRFPGFFSNSQGPAPMFRSLWPLTLIAAGAFWLFSRARRRYIG